jgi:mono/diheme cytochrome c family protein
MRSARALSSAVAFAALATGVAAAACSGPRCGDFRTVPHAQPTSHASGPCPGGPCAPPPPPATPVQPTGHDQPVPPGSELPPAPPNGDAAPSSAAPPEPPLPLTVDSQISRGRALFAASCATCHGDAGQGTEKAPMLVGAGALPSEPPAARTLRTVRFENAADVARFVTANMPPEGKGPGTSPEDAHAIVAFALDANGIRPQEPLDAANAASVRLAR